MIFPIRLRAEIEATIIYTIEASYNINYPSQSYFYKKMKAAIKDIISEVRVNSNELSINVIEDLNVCGLYLGQVRKDTNIRLHIQN